MRNTPTPWPALVAAALLLGSPAVAFGYLDPGTQSQMLSLLVPILGGIGLAFAALIWPFKRFLWWLKKKVGAGAAWAVFIGVLVLVLGGAATMWVVIATWDEPETTEGPTVAKASYERFERVIVLGMDGLSPAVMGPMMDAGELPNFAKLREAGGYAPLQTTLPPETPVAWSGLGTGCNPGKHGIFDFLHRDPKTYRPILSIYRVNRKNILDKRERRYVPVRKAYGFWSFTSAAEVPTTVIRWPSAFPPEKVTGRFLSGLGVPDVRAGLGKYALFTTQPGDAPAGFKGHWLSAAWDGDTFRHTIAGPVVASGFGRKQAELDVVVRRGDGRITLQIGEADAVTLKVGQWSGWIPLRFEAGLGKIRSAQVKAYLTALTPELKLYVSTPEIDPTDPDVPITYPDDYAKELAAAIGAFSTLGMAEDVNAMKDGSLSPAAFERSMLDLFDERMKQFRYEFERFEKGVFAFVFDASDRIQHMYWRTRDPEHPNYDADFAAKFGHVIPDMYKRMDAVLGEVLARADEKTVVICVSDHGFETYRTSVALNSWLVENGYMTLNTSDGRNGAEMFANVDWSRTKAYALGFAGLYINRKGREKHGIVKRGAEYDALCDELVSKMRRMADPVSAKPAVRNVYLAREHYHGEHAASGPDLIVGFNAGFRHADASVLGGAPVAVFSDNMDMWSGDHLMDPHVVPGVFFANRALRRERPRNIDLAPTVLQCFGIPRPDTMDGEAIF